MRFGSKANNLVLYNLALDRILSIEPANDVAFRENPDFNPDTFFGDVIGVSKNIGNTPRRIKFWATAEQSKYIMTKPLHHSQKLIHRFEDGNCEFMIQVVINYEMYSVFMSYGPGIKILSPRIAAHYMKDKLRQAAEQYNEDEVEAK